jgi:hypothetical protein
MGITDDPNNPCLKEIGPDGQQACYLVLSKEERELGFVRPVRDTYKHVGVRPKNPLRDLTPEEKERYAPYGYVKFEAYPADRLPVTGRFWTQEQLNSGCGAVTRMAREIAETYARKPEFYGKTFCNGCACHLPVNEFCWIGADGKPDGSFLGE